MHNFCTFLHTLRAKIVRILGNRAKIVRISCEFLCSRATKFIVMATVNYYLDSRRLRKDGTAPLRLSVRWGRQSVMIPADVLLRPDQWNPLHARVVNHPRQRMLNTYLDSFKVTADEIVRKMTSGGRCPTPDAVRKSIMAGDAQEPGTSFLDIYRKVMDDPRIKQRTKEIYGVTLRKVIAYSESTSTDAETLRFEDITRTWAADFDRWLMDDCPSRNARNMHLRNIRHVCNVAVTDHITDFYDWRGFSIKAVPTVKRSLSVEALRTFLAADVDEQQRQYLDMFRLIFFLVGINTIDLCHLRKTDVNEGRVEYTRSKTSRFYSIRIEPEAQDIINRYAGKGEWLLNILDRYVNFKDYAHRLNENLQKIGPCVTGKHGRKIRQPLHPNITTYWARHTWATIAASLDIPNETIAAALGHGYGNRITAIYIDFDRRKVDEANRRVIDWVLYGEK